MDWGEETLMRYQDIVSAGKEGHHWVGHLALATADMRYRDIASAERKGERIGHSAFVIADRRFRNVASAGNGWALFCMNVRWRVCDAKTAMKGKGK